MKSDILVKNYLENLYLIKSFDTIHEGIIKDVIDKLTPDKIKDIMNKIKSSVKSKDISGVKKIVNSLKLPSIPTKSLEKMWIKMSPDFPKSYSIAKTTTSKLFPNIPKKTADAGALLVAGISSIKSKNPEDDTIKNLQRLSSISKIKNESELLKESDIVSLFIIGTVGVSILTLAAPGIMGSLGAGGILAITILALISIKVLLG